jgi:hypothetical protein
VKLARLDPNALYGGREMPAGRRNGQTRAGKPGGRRIAAVNARTPRGRKQIEEAVG